MTIETKFNVGDTLYVLDDNRVCLRHIIVIDIWANREGANIRYKMATLDTYKNCKEYYDEARCFLTKEELLQSL